MLELIIENWNKFIEEGISETGVQDYKYYAFDWDDNLVEMPTKIILVSEDGSEVGMGTADFALYRGRIGKEPFLYNNKKIKDFSKNAFRNFRVSGDGQFLKDIMEAEPAPSWEDFVECINGASIFAIITARGHSPSTLKRAVYKYIISNYNGIDQRLLRKNIKKYNNIFNKTGRDVSIKSYLDLCKFYPVSYGAGSASNPEQAKALALREFVDYCVKINKGLPISVGFSDDDKKNMEIIERHFSNEADLPKMIFKYTGKQ